MITIDPDKSKVLEFKINISGNASQPSARLVMPLGENLNLSILGEVHNSAIQVTVPKLRHFYEGLKSGSIQLEIIVDGNVFIPWIDQVEFKETLKVVAEVVSEKDIIQSNKSVQVGASLISETVITKDILPAKSKNGSFKPQTILSDYL
jgi:hypothetical protein